MINDELEIRHSQCLNGSPAFQFAMRAYAEFPRPDLDQLTISGNTQLIYALSLEHVPVHHLTGRFVGIIMYDLVDKGCYNAYYVVRSYVVPHFRKEGVFSAMWQQLIERAPTEIVTKIYSTTGITNTLMQEIIGKQGRELKSYNAELLLSTEKPFDELIIKPALQHES